MDKDKNCIDPATAAAIGSVIAVTAARSAGSWLLTRATKKVWEWIRRKKHVKGNNTSIPESPPNNQS